MTHVKAERILEACCYVIDLDTAVEFYRRVLGLTLHSRFEDRHVFFRCGDAMFLLFNPARTQQADGSVGAHGAFGQGHVAFAAREADLDAWRAQLWARDIPIEREIDWPGGGHSIYFRDPLGNSVELATPKLWGLAE